MEQLVAQTEEIYKRKHVYRTEIFQLQDLYINDKENVNESLIALAAQSVQQSTAARVGMFTKNRYDKKSARWKKDTENPLRVRDVKHKVRKLVLRNAKGALKGEATSQMQLNWRRVKKQYFEVYLFPICSDGECGASYSPHDDAFARDRTAVWSVSCVPRWA